MEKKIIGTKVSFYDNDIEIMYMDIIADEFVWYFSSSNKIIITEDMDLYELLKLIMSNEYIFGDDEILKCYKDDKKLIWYSDCYYSEWSKNSISYLTIEYDNNKFKLWCTKPIDKYMKRPYEYHVIAFSPAFNGRYTKNTSTGNTLQTDFILNVYQKLLEKEKVKTIIKE